MITIYTPQGKELRQIPDDDFFKHVTAMELLAHHPEYDEDISGWSFIVYTGAIRMCTGNQEKAQLIPLMPDIDINRLQKYWYLHYCEAHGYGYTVTRMNTGKPLAVPYSPWAFIIYSPEDVRRIYKQAPNLSSGLTQAYEVKMGAIELCKGDVAKPIWIPLTPELDIADLQEHWRNAFLKSHGIAAKENS